MIIINHRVNTINKLKNTLNELTETMEVNKDDQDALIKLKKCV